MNLLSIYIFHVLTSLLVETKRVGNCDERLHCRDDQVYCSSHLTTKRKMCVERENIQRNCLPPINYLKLRCRPDEFQCKESKKCIPRKLVKDGWHDCKASKKNPTDESDEQTPFDSCHNDTEFRCRDKSSQCILREMVMNRRPDCKDKSDENEILNCYTQTEFACRDNHRCIPRYRVNDGFSDCLDSSDENRTQFSCYEETEFSCNEKRCIPRSWVGNSIEDCKSGEDESYKFSKCLSDEFQCLDKSRCLPTSYVCDGTLNCKDGSDEIEFCNLSNYIRCNECEIKLFQPIIRSKNLKHFPNKGIKSCSDLVFGFKCLVPMGNTTQISNSLEKEIRTVPQHYINNNISICFSREDRCYNEENQFVCSRCLDNKTIISKSQICDNYIDCPDMSDECTCGNNEIEPLCEMMYPITTSSKQSNQLNFNQICNQIVDLKDGIDERFCNYKVLSLLTKSTTTKSPINQSYRCLSYNINKSTQRSGNFCDGIVDCPLKDDECSSECINVDSLHHFSKCIDLHQKNRGLKILKLYFSKCVKFVRLDYDRVYLLHNIHVGPCWIFDYKSLYFVEKFENMSTNFKPSTDLLSRYKAKKINVYNFGHSDSIMNIEGGQNTSFSKFSDLCNLEKFICPWRFYCHSNITQSIDLKYRCDLNKDCSDGSDEMNCSSKTHFYCLNKEPIFINKNKVLDCKKDCSDGSDEDIKDEFSSSFEMIKSKHLHLFIWFSSIITILVNLIVLQKHLVKLLKIQNKSSLNYINTWLLCQLAFADLIMGFVLLILGIKSQQFSGKYCYHDLEWRSSVTCNVIGVLTVLSSQTSMSILVIITILRLHAVICPLKSNQLNFKLFFLVSTTVWLLSLLFALIPVWFKTVFTDKFYIEPNPFLPQSFNFVRLEKFYKRAEIIPLLYSNLSFDLKNTSRSSLKLANLKSWFFNSAEGKLRFPNRNIKVKSTFGYYSSSAVCFPNFYTKASSSHFIISFSMIAFNFLALFFIASAYIIIYYFIRQSMKKSNNQSNDNQMLKLKRRVFYIIVTDMVCWLPIIIMSFMSYNGYNISGIVIPISSIVLLPVNSAINPMIYSRLDKNIFRQIKKIFACIRKPKENHLKGKPLSRKYTETTF